MNVQELYQQKLCTAEEAVKLVKSGDWVDYSQTSSFPIALDAALAARRDELSEVKIRGGLVIRPRIEAVECDPEQKAFSYYSWHIGDYERKLQSRGLCRFLPMVLRYLPELYRSHIRVDTAFVPVSRPDGEGYCGLGISNYAWRTIFEQARTVIFEINEQLPTLQGVDGSHRVHLSEADFVVEGAHEPLPIRTYKDPSPIDVQIAEHVVREIPNGATLSLGVGGVPFTVAKLLAQSDLTDLGCHTGTISDAFLALHRAGKLTNRLKEVDAGRSTWNLAMGSQELYDWLQAEPDRFRPGDVVIETVAREYLAPLREAGVDTLVLGCTHYPLLQEVIGGVMGPEVALVDVGAEAAGACRDLLAAEDALADRPAGSVRFYTSDRAVNFQRLASLFLGEEAGGAVEQVDIFQY